MNKTSILKFSKYLKSKLSHLAAALLVFFTLAWTPAQALDTSPHREEVDGVSRYGYWQEGTTAGYWDEAAGYWDYSADLGHFVTIYSNSVYDEQGNFVSEDSSQVWVLDPEWVSAPQYVDQSTPDTWIDLEPPQNEQSLSKTFAVLLDVSNPYVEEPCGFRAHALLEWTIDDQGTYHVSNYIVELGSRLGPFGFSFDNQGNHELLYEIHAEDAHLHWIGHVWSPLDLSVYLPWTDAAIDWDIDILMDYPSGIPSGKILGVHDHFPNFYISINSRNVYDFNTFVQAGESPIHLLDSDTNVPVNEDF